MSEIRAEITANVWQVASAVGDVVAEGDEVAILESMKMEIPVIAEHAGTVTAVNIEPGATVREGDVMFVIADEG